MSEEPRPSESTAATADGSLPRSNPRKTRIRRLIAVVAIAVVTIVLLSLVLLGVFSGTHSASAPGPDTFLQAQALADSIASSHGDWLLGFASGYALSYSENASLPFPPSFSGCSVSWFVNPPPSILTVPAFRGNQSSGGATEWYFIFDQPSNENVLGITVVEGSVFAALELSGANCSAGDGVASPWGPVVGVVDSSVAAASALGAGGSALLKAHPTGVSLYMIVQSPRAWVFVWTTCFFSPDQYGWIGNGTQFTSSVNATTGEVLPNSTQTQRCGGPPPIGEALHFGNASLYQEQTGGTLKSEGCDFMDFCYRLPITVGSWNVTPADLSLGVYLNNNGVNGVIGYAILNATGHVIVSAQGPYTGAGGTPWVSPTGSNTTLLADGMALTIDMGSQSPQGMGYVLSTSGYGPSFAWSPYFDAPLP